MPPIGPGKAPLSPPAAGKAELRVERNGETNQHRAAHGLARKLLANMVQGVSVGFSRVLEISGVGYRAEVKGESIQLATMRNTFSH